MASVSLMCFAKSLATMASLVWNVRRTLDKASALTDRPVRKIYLVMSAARSPAEVTTMVCGAPVFLEANDILFLCPGLETYRSRKFGISGRSLGLPQSLVSTKAFSIPLFNIQLHTR